MTIPSALERLCNTSEICAAVIDLFEKELRFPIQRITELPVPINDLLKDNYRESFRHAVEKVYFPGVVSEEAFDGAGGKEMADALIDAGLADY
ncbi:hypothetical protein [uncultured Desulfosarcina sp.]|uniref:hypothetical protein n=1 Tax=uncultured Desulfosarcina sp. TaxID=218289 RepID=UPI0029C6AC47|nr:hypothetical protein [uncultured Desulfosarcina sp.]